MPRILEMKIMVALLLAVGCDSAADGVDGTDGVDGSNGANGLDGVNGVDGANGANGTDGTDGAAGADGEDAPVDYSSVNLVAAHDASSPQYRDDCLECHYEEILLATTRDAAIDTFHVGMIKVLYPTYSIPDDVTAEVCQDCHSEGVDLMTGSQAAFRRQVSTEDNCYICHSGGAWPLYTY